MRHLLPSLILVALLAMLMLRGYVHSEILADHRVRTPAATDQVPDRILDGGPVIDARAATPAKSLEIPDHRLVLTFDDGPDPVWTPKVLDKLKKYHAHGVFFVTGTMASRYPALVKRMVDEGHEVGLHTFNHPDLSFQTRSRIDWELSQNQLALAGAAGIRTSLFRPPYSSFADAMDNKSWPVARHLGSLGYITVLDSIDSEDWQRPGAAAIVEGATPKGDKGSIVLMHDSGGDRSQTVAALDRYLPDMRARGFTFANLTEALGAPSAHTRVTGPDLWKGRAWVGAVTLSGNITDVLIVGLSVIGVLVLVRFGLMLVLSFAHARKVRRRGFGWGEQVTEPVTVLVPAYNERECIANTVRSLRDSDHPIEIVVIDDGSTDGTADIVDALRLPNVRVVRQENAGKPAALNNGIAHAGHDLVVMMDGDTVFEPSTVRELVQPFGDPRVGAVAGTPRSATATASSASWQHIEYVMGFNLDRRMYDMLRCMPTIPGAVGAFRRRALERVGGDERGHPRRGHRHHDGHAPRRLARRLRGTRPRLDGGAGVRAAAVVPALPLELRHDAGDLEAPPGARRTWPVRTFRPGRSAAGLAVHGAGAPAGAADRRVPAVRPGLRPHAADGRGLARCPARPGGLRGVRLPARPGADEPSDLAAPPADPLPAAHVRGAAPVLDHGAHRRPAAVAEAAPYGRGGGAGLDPGAARAWRERESRCGRGCGCWCRFRYWSRYGAGPGTAAAAGTDRRPVA